MDYDAMGDDEIRSKLTEAGIPVGPIVDATRSVYIRKLQRLHGELPDLPQEPADEDEESEGEPSPQKTPPKRPMTAKVRTPPATPSGDSPTGEVRQRRQQRKLDVPITKEVTEPARGGMSAFIIKLFLFIVIVLVVLYVMGLMSEEGPVKELAGSD